MSPIGPNPDLPECPDVRSLSGKSRLRASRIRQTRATFTTMLGHADQGFVDVNAMALNAAISAAERDPAVGLMRLRAGRGTRRAPAPPSGPAPDQDAP